ncbi:MULTISPECIES: hypothetical protein [Pseudobutyrivibrio]|uniref:WXG100 protein secretion system (Wss), protein YukD n=1 Tax=Pseudobutyrivibrio xylanivorans TaxID=185007 RepID=A0A1G5S512_PSEXY|nr:MULTISPECIES: hypothetical protein [Pseudobutyrivibrio]MDC7278403.1 hypothetical protein [Butyrivibrio fibrisolvens]SCZ81445.1 hypothetical protein SAMN02910350_02823 [Pseudobutyrivibrio xylanivorans]
MKDKMIIEFCWGDSKQDIEVPKSLTCDELIYALNEGIGLGLDVNNADSFAFSCDVAKSAIKGEKTLEEVGLMDGATVILHE